MIGDFLYKLTPRDQQVTGLELVGLNGSNAAAALIVAPTWAGGAGSIIVPDNRVFVLQNIAFQLNPGGAQYGKDFTLSCNWLGSGQIFPLWTRSFFMTPGAGGSNKFYGSESVEIYLPPGTELTASGSFDLPVAVNQVLVSLTGILIPRGDIAI